MRPLSLTLEGFTCFKQRQTVSFDGLELFAIWGPTGAGKTSLLDAMVFALYGNIPRLDENRNHDVVSLTRDKAVVLFEFSVGPEKYRVVRTMKRKGAPEAKLEDGDGNLLAEGVRGVEAEILRRLGLSYDAFVQAVMLPQGEFAKFLKSEPRQRRMILRDLLRLEVYERMRGRAEHRRRDVESRLSEVERVIGEYADATFEHLEKVQVEAGKAQENRKIKRESLAALSAQLPALEALRTKTKELEQLRKQLAELNVHEPKVREASSQVEASERAAAAMPHVARAGDAQTAAEQERAAVQRAKEALEKEMEQYNRAERAAKRAGEDAKQIGPTRDRIRELDRIRGIVEARSGALSRLANAKTALVAAEALISVADSQLAERHKEFTRLEREVARAKDELGKVAYDKELDVLAQGATRIALQLADERRRASVALKEARQAEASAATARGEADKLAKALNQARLNTGRATKSLARAEKAYQDAHERHATVILRRALRPGEPCPVCVQQVRSLPKAIAAPELDLITGKYTEAKEAETEARDTEKRITAKHAALEAAADQMTNAATASKDVAQKASVKLTTLEGRLIEQVGTRFDKESGSTIEGRIISGTDRLADLRANHSQGLDRLVELERRRDIMRTAIGGNETEIKRLREAADRARQHVVGIAEEVKELDVKIKAVTTHPDPLAQSAELDEKVKDLERRVEISKAAFADASAKLATAQAISSSALEKCQRAVEKAAELLKEAETAAKKAGFHSLETATASVLESAKLAQLRKSIEDYRIDYHAIGQRISIMEGELRGREVSDAELSETTRSLEKVRQENEMAVATVATLEEQIRQTRDRMGKREQFGTMREEIKIELGLYQQLAEELRTDRFQEFVMEEVFQELARGASERLKELTGRYALKYQGGDMRVLDHDNADEMRSTDTLSGGEMFLASLALALELSARIQQAAGAVLLESLFIDEGFGTLDLETLDNATSAIESLQGGGRMVGIITHIRDLADRLPCRIEVSWRSEGSRVDVKHS